MLKNKTVKNATWIIVCKIIQAGLTLVVTMLSSRVLGPAGYGLINYAMSIVTFLAPIMYLGFTSVLVQEIVQHPELEGETLGTAVAMSFFSSLVCIGGVAAFVSIANKGETETLIVCLLYSVLLIFQSVEIIVYWFQAKLLSKYSSLTILAAFIAVSLYQLWVLFTGKSIYWFAISNALNYFLIASILIIIYKKLGGQKLSFSFNTFRRMFARSKYYIISDMMITIFAQTDRIMIKLMLGDSQTGYYSAAVTCATMTGFVFTAIIDSMRPTILEAKKDNTPGYELNLKRLYNIVIYLSMLQSLLITLLSGLIVRILYGSDYAAAVPALRIVAWYTTFSYIGSVRNIWILAEGKQKYLLCINMLGAVANVALNFLLIGKFGINGAAFASLITQIFTNVIIGFIFKDIRQNNYIMLKSLSPNIFFGMLRR